eukprot:gene14091-21571_t
MSPSRRSCRRRRCSWPTTRGRAVDAARVAGEAAHSAVVRAFAEAVLAQRGLRRRIVAAHAGLAERVRSAVVRSLLLAAALREVEADEAAARPTIADSELWALLDLGVRCHEDYRRVTLLEANSQEAAYRKSAEAEESLERDSQTTPKAIQNQHSPRSCYESLTFCDEETTARAELRAEELVSRAGWSREACGSYAAARMAEEERAEQHIRRTVAEPAEAAAFSILSHWAAEGLKAFLQRTTEPTAREAVAAEEAETWSALASAMTDTLVPHALESLTTEEELNRFGYRGVGGLVFDEQNAWDALLGRHARQALIFLAGILPGRRLNWEEAARLRVAREEAGARQLLSTRYRAESAPHRIRLLFAGSLPERQDIEVGEYSIRKKVERFFAVCAADLLVRGSGHENEPGARRILEKMRRDGIRQLCRGLRLSIAESKETEYRGLLEAMRRVQLEEMHGRRAMLGPFGGERAAMQRKFAKKRGRLLGEYADDVHWQMERDAWAEEVARRHYGLLGRLREKTQQTARNIVALGAPPPAAVLEEEYEASPDETPAEKHPPSPYLELAERRAMLSPFGGERVAVQRKVRRRRALADAWAEEVARRHYGLLGRLREKTQQTARNIVALGAPPPAAVLEEEYEASPDETPAEKHPPSPYSVHAA